MENPLLTMLGGKISCMPRGPPQKYVLLVLLLYLKLRTGFEIMYRKIYFLKIKLRVEEIKVTPRKKQQNNPTPGHIPEENHHSKRYMHPNVYCSSIYNSQAMEAT